MISGDVMKTAKELFLEAVEKNEVNKYFRGDGNYKVPVPHMVPINIPTDWTYIIPAGVYELYRERPDLRVDELFQTALLEMAANDNLGLYAAVNLVFDQLLREKDGSAPFAIDKERLLPLLQAELSKKRSSLKGDFTWMGKGNPEGLWSELNRIDSLIRKKTGFKIIKDGIGLD